MHGSFADVARNFLRPEETGIKAVYNVLGRRVTVSRRVGCLMIYVEDGTEHKPYPDIVVMETINQLREKRIPIDKLPL
jgi:hypothetical protein